MVIGTETGKCKGKIDAKKEWADHLVAVARKYGCRIFSKKSSFIKSWAKKTQFKSSL